MDLQDLFRSDRERAYMLRHMNRFAEAKVENQPGWTRQSYRCPLDGDWLDGRCLDCKHNVYSEKKFRSCAVTHYCMYGKGEVQVPAYVMRPITLEV